MRASVYLMNLFLYFIITLTVNYLYRLILTEKPIDIQIIVVYIIFI